MLPGKHVLSEREGAPFVGYWMWSEHEKRNEVFAVLRVAYDAALASAESFRARRAALQADGKLTDKGISDELLGEARSKLLPKLAADKLAAVASIKRDANARLEAMSSVKIDRTDVVSEMQRKELRDAIKAMKASDREAFLKVADDFTLDAVLSVPPVLTGVHPAVLENMREARMERLYGAEKQALGVLMEAVQAVERAYDAARDEVRDSLGLKRPEFDKITTPIDAEVRVKAERTLESTPVIEQPLADVAKLAEVIRGLPFGDRNNLLDLALERQVDDLKSRQEAA